MTVGDVIRVPENFYRFGTGPLVVHVCEVLDRREIDGALWVELIGRNVRPDGSVDVRQRFALVRLDRTSVVAR
ncbi:hypothetical protein [Micromonospora purpureochromogenes]|uniref:DUF3850 domain-containing protein n=1 Tax=Micromonospora purpureochromogenes TaxID=47872 RepID=A0ABX2RQN7_9ACTN|nr:hypothetical protein [Micromonospora purpureochromogenes]NYF58849.1 hypothetical protein [Micromonospora purpureochromogenes]